MIVSEIQSRAHDAVASGVAVTASAASYALNDWLQTIVLSLTIGFLVLGIFMRFKKLKEDDPSKD